MCFSMLIRSFIMSFLNSEFLVFSMSCSVNPEVGIRFCSFVGESSIIFILTLCILLLQIIALQWSDSSLWCRILSYVLHRSTVIVRVSHRDILWHEPISSYKDNWAEIQGWSPTLEKSKSDTCQMGSTLGQMSQDSSLWSNFIFIARSFALELSHASGDICASNFSLKQHEEFWNYTKLLLHTMWK